MKSNSSTPAKRAKGLVLGRERFIKFSAVEGIHLTDDDRSLIKEMDARGLQPDERRKTVLARFAKRA